MEENNMKKESFETTVERMDVKPSLLKTTTGLITIGVICFVIGFFGGMEYKAYQIRQAFSTVTDGIGEIFSGDEFDNKVDVVDKEKMQDTSDINAIDVKEEKKENKVDMEVIEKGFISKDFQDFIVMKMKFTNKSGKDIKGVKGMITFYDIFDEEIKSTSVIYDDGLKVGEDKIFESGMNYNQFMDSDAKLKQVDFEDLKYVWNVTTIVYDDGESETF